MANRSALVMGVGEYGEGFAPLPGCLLDVREMARVLEDSDCGGFQVNSLENPDRDRMTTAIERFFGGREADDFLLLYFSGHGDLGSGGMLQQHLHFCGRTSHKQNQRLVESSAMPADFLKRQMGLSKAKKIVVILDCCYSGAIADLLKKGEGDIDFSELRAAGRVILASSSAAQTSLQEVDGLSLYTRYLIEGMAGAAYPGHGKWIAAKDLHDYADRRFEIENKGYQPKIIVEETGFDLPVVKAPKPDAKLSYRKAVDELFRELDAELGLEFDGAISDPLDRGRLDTLRDRLSFADEVAQAIEQQVQKPYLVRATQRRAYAGYFEQAIQSGKPLSDRQRRQLEQIRQNIGLGQDDTSAIERSVIERLPDFRNNFSLRGERTASIFNFEYATIAVPSLKITKHPGQAEYFTEDLGDGVTIEMVRIPAGEFMMGSPNGEEGAFDDEKRQHKVKVPEFWMGKFQVTQAQWGAIAKLPKINQDLDPDPAHFKGKNLPVERVSWLDAIEFCDRLAKRTGKAYRLPSEAEWEYACRAGTTTPFNFGETISTDLANYDGNPTYGNGVEGEYRKKTIDVGSFPPNAFGLSDMHGNVWEWCADLLHENYQGAPIDGSAWGDRSLKSNVKRVLRGGSWCNHPRLCRSAHRGGVRADDRDWDDGFRMLCPPPGSLL
jgi:formylglycine-generating enzyme required for sulfatase activity